MSPLEIYGLFVLPGAVIVAGCAFIVYGRRELRRRAERAARVSGDAA